MSKILKLPAVMEKTALSRSSIYAFIKNQTFPQPIQLGARAVGWHSTEIENWLQERAELRGAK